MEFAEVVKNRYSCKKYDGKQISATDRRSPFASMTEADRTARPDAYRQRPSEPLLSCHAGREPIPP